MPLAEVASAPSWADRVKGRPVQPASKAKSHTASGKTEKKAAGQTRQKSPPKEDGQEGMYLSCDSFTLFSITFLNGRKVSCKIWASQHSLI